MKPRTYKPITRDDIIGVIVALNLVPKRNGLRFQIERGFACDDYTAKLIVHSEYGRSAFRRYFKKCGVKGLVFQGAYLMPAPGCEWHIEFSLVV